MVTSRVSCTIDFDGTGKRVGYLGVPHSGNESAYQTITVPIASLNNGVGPTVLFTGGVHGDEYEGPVALMNFVREIEAEQIQGRVIVIPNLNLPAAMAGLRCSPIDGLNLNRVFPGNPDGTVTDMIAHYVCEALLPITDVQVDLHSGGKTLEYIPSINMEAPDDLQRARETFAALRAFGAPVALIHRSLDAGGQLTTETERRGIINLNTELGGAGRVDRNTVVIAREGVLNLLKHFEVLAGDPRSAEQQGRAPTRLAEIADMNAYVMAPDRGLFEPFVALGEEISAGMPIGQLHYVDNLTRAPWVIEATADGFLICFRPPGRVERGDNIAIIAADLDPTKYGWG
ncbi:MAG: succinylglutamate desuccinylase/aspartoacylase family protein [Pseudomonadota bacterium]